jgi:hypothetical protein
MVVRGWLRATERNRRRKGKRQTTNRGHTTSRARTFEDLLQQLRVGLHILRGKRKGEGEHARTRRDMQARTGRGPENNGQQQPSKHSRSKTSYKTSHYRVSQGTQNRAVSHPFAST